LYGGGNETILLVEDDAFLRASPSSVPPGLPSSNPAWVKHPMAVASLFCTLLVCHDFQCFLKARFCGGNEKGVRNHEQRTSKRKCG
jgi:hypothetical protein